MSTATSAEESEKEMSSPKRMRNESDDETTTYPMKMFPVHQTTANVSERLKALMKAKVPKR